MDSGSGDCETEEDSAPETSLSPSLPSNTREMRNRAEKMRRDKLNAYITELATLVPMVAGSAKRMDKTSILRLTATHLRIYHTLVNKAATNKGEFNMVDQIALAQMIYEQLAGFLLIVTADGKIVFVSHTVEQILGHLQTDLMGQSLYTITPADDHSRLKVQLNPQTAEMDWRRYFRLGLAKAGPRNEPPTYESFSVMGMVRPNNDNQRQRENTKVSREVFVFFLTLMQPTPTVERLMDPNRDEYVTRHLIDGRIISCDHRISLVAGYMIEEVAGKSAFLYMHKEDVRWTMIALRQMYDKGEDQGWSCYRLQTRTGKFIYLRTCGYLELDSNGSLESFVCVNTLVDESEGDKLIKEMKERYSVMINASASAPIEISEVSVESTEDPEKLDVCIKHLITNLPTSPRSESHPSPCPSIESKDCIIAPETPPHFAEISQQTQSQTQSKTQQKNRSKRSTSEDEFTQKRHKRRAQSIDISSEPYTPNGGEYVETMFKPKHRMNLQMES